MKDVIQLPAQILSRDDGETIAYRQIDGKPPCVIFLGGFMSDMSGTKALELERHCRSVGQAFLRFDYRGHGESSGDFQDATISHWLLDALAVIDACTRGPLILVGSSMGGWIMLLAALARLERVAGLIGIAAAPDFTRDLMWDQFSKETKQILKSKGVYYEQSEYDGQPYPITMKLIIDGQKHLLLDGPIGLHCPMRLLHGMKDRSVPWTTASRLAERMQADDLQVLLVKDGDHRLSRDQDIFCVKLMLDELLKKF